MHEADREEELLRLLGEMHEEDDDVDQIDL